MPPPLLDRLKLRPENSAGEFSGRGVSVLKCRARLTPPFMNVNAKVADTLSVRDYRCQYGRGESLCPLEFVWPPSVGPLAPKSVDLQPQCPCLNPTPGPTRTGRRKSPPYYYFTPPISLHAATDSRMALSAKKFSEKFPGGSHPENVWPISTQWGPVLPRAGLRHSEKAHGGLRLRASRAPSAALVLAADKDGRLSKSPATELPNRCISRPAPIRLRGAWRRARAASPKRKTAAAVAMSPITSMACVCRWAELDPTMDPSSCIVVPQAPYHRPSFATRAASDWLRYRGCRTSRCTPPVMSRARIKAGGVINPLDKLRRCHRPTPKGSTRPTLTSAAESLHGDRMPLSTDFLAGCATAGPPPDNWSSCPRTMSPTCCMREGRGSGKQLCDPLGYILGAKSM
jgi:hypothetical protein